jgi:7-cyano-7-deazaguanine synthase
MTVKAIVSLSGGMDSATLLATAVRQLSAPNVYCVGFTYGSKHNKYENKGAYAVAAYYGVPLDLIDLSVAFKGFRSDLLKTGGDVPEGHYEAESMRRTVVPCRNLIFLSVLAGLAESWGCGQVWLGVHAGDHHIYPDCRPDFVWRAGGAVSLATDGKVNVQTPYLNLTKADILRIGLGEGVPYNLTRTCYKDQPVACGRCGSCQERLEAFAKNGVADPLEYESREILPKEDVKNV